MARVQSDWALGAFTFVYLPMTAIGRFAVITERKQPSMGKPEVRAQESLAHYPTQIFGPRDGHATSDLACSALSK